MDRWTRLVEHLSDGGDRVRVSWAQLEGLVGPLPASASNHRAWWSGDRPHVRAWRTAGFVLGGLAQGEFVEFRREGPTVAPRRATTAVATPVRSTSRADILLIACVKTKRDVPAAAKDLYVSPLFAKERAYAESRPIPWFILSAEYGLVAPDEWLEPYERYLPDMSSSARTSWGASVVERLEELAGPLDAAAVEIHAGRAYIDALRLPLRRAGAQLSDPLVGLRQGERLRWYDARAHGPTTAVSVPAAQASANDEAEGVAEVVIAHLVNRQAGVSPEEFIARGRGGLTSPGLYSWWVDQQGADDLTAGLGQPLEEGLVYAGAAGATRWPSGRRSTNTLWGRIAGMHLGRSQELSTFRKTLAAILAAAWSTPGLSEERLTEWMRRHLTVISVVSEDADRLGRLEESVLQHLDPPLNLRGMEPTATRLRLRALRRALPSPRPRTRGRR
ncbi:DUF6884 domain-containing protein [Actinomycetospora sp. CA-084318]|uniref:DUF6884 domain-containing protein n=1 Tax=Actinomycetospora sp. CA-084318 TaxID=3239892 RepID=UPI003D974709